MKTPRPIPADAPRHADGSVALLKDGSPCRCSECRRAGRVMPVGPTRAERKAARHQARKAALKDSPALLELISERVQDEAQREFLAKIIDGTMETRAGLELFKTLFPNAKATLIPEPVADEPEPVREAPRPDFTEDELASYERFAATRPLPEANRSAGQLEVAERARCREYIECLRAVQALDLTGVRQAFWNADIAESTKAHRRRPAPTGTATDLVMEALNG